MVSKDEQICRNCHHEFDCHEESGMKNDGLGCRNIMGTKYERCIRKSMTSPNRTYAFCGCKNFKESLK